MQLKKSYLPPFLPRLTRRARPIALGMALAIAGGLSGAPLSAQGMFAPAITVNDAVITNYELSQRAQFMRLLRAPGDPVDLAREALIDDRLKQQAVIDAKIDLTPEQLEAGIAEFAARTDLAPDEFVRALNEGGVSYETFRDFVKINLIWREYIRQKFLPRTRPSKNEVDRAMGAGTSGSNVSVLLNEIIIPITPQTLDQVEKLATQLAQIEGFAAFGEAAQQYSASQTRQSGGRMPMMPLSQLPPALRPVILALRPGEVTPPIPLSNAVALFQMREVRETGVTAPSYAKIDYMRYLIPGGRSPEALEHARRVAARADTCDDLYAVAKGQPPEVLELLSQSPADIPADIALELAKLDEGEVSTTLTRSNGQTLMLLMLCGRTASAYQEASRDDVANMLIQQRLESFSKSHLDQLRGDALILTK